MIYSSSLLCHHLRKPNYYSLVTCEEYFLFRLGTGVVSMMLISRTPIWFLATFLMIDFVPKIKHSWVFKKQNCEVSENSGGPYT